jgi:hypothetical protein
MDYIYHLYKVELGLNWGFSEEKGGQVENCLCKPCRNWMSPTLFSSWEKECVYRVAHRWTHSVQQWPKMRTGYLMSMHRGKGIPFPPESALKLVRYAMSKRKNILRTSYEHPQLSHRPSSSSIVWCHCALEYSTMSHCDVCDSSSRWIRAFPPLQTAGHRQRPIPW